MVTLKAMDGQLESQDFVVKPIKMLWVHSPQGSNGQLVAGAISRTIIEIMWIIGALTVSSTKSFLLQDVVPSKTWANSLVFSDIRLFV